MSEEWKKLVKIPKMILKNQDGWEYRCTCYADIIEVEYWEERPEGMMKTSKFVVPTFCAEQLFTELAEMSKNAPEEE